MFESEYCVVIQCVHTLSMCVVAVRRESEGGGVRARISAILCRLNDKQRWWCGILFVYWLIIGWLSVYVSLFYLLKLLFLSFCWFPCVICFTFIYCKSNRSTYDIIMEKLLRQRDFIFYFLFFCLSICRFRKLAYLTYIHIHSNKCDCSRFTSLYWISFDSLSMYVESFVL